MRILVLGGGLMGPAAAYNAMVDPDVTGITIVDQNPAQLKSAGRILHDKPGFDKVTHRQLNLAEWETTVDLMAEFDAAVAALPRPVNLLAIKAALHAGLPLVDLAQTPQDILGRLKAEATADRGFVILGCGVEPGLTEIVARHLAEKLDRVDELHILCGGIPETPAPPLGYKIVFGGRQMPLHEADSEIVRDGKIEFVPRYSGVETVYFPGVGRCEAWHEGFKPWLLDIPALKNIKLGTQKTVRWPGYAEKITVLKELGLLSLKPVDVAGASVAPKQLLDAVLYPSVKLETGDRDITCFRVTVLGERDSKTWKYEAEMVDRFDEETGFTSMARTTAMTGAIVARMIGKSMLKPDGRRWVNPEKVIAGELFDYLMAELRAANIQISMTYSEVQPAGY